MSIQPEPNTTEVTQAGTDRSGETGAAPVLEATAPVLPERIDERYLVKSELGRGGMAVVYRVLDSQSGRELALKQLTMQSNERYFREQSAAFEREYHTLVQLSHPRIIAVYDFGNDANGRYYTMELLEGADLRERSPLPWREACRLLHDVTSSLALLHSRRLVHRDISPRNVRSTRDGTAKLIDFGALVPMGAPGQIVGTPPFLPPEVLHRSTLDARTDLFSLGATLYYTLTGRFAYPARDFSRLQEAWSKRPAPPSIVTPGIPPALDALVMSLISLDPELRPRTAFEVMQRLAALAEIERSEAEEVSQAYVSTPVMLGRDAVLSEVRKRLQLALGGQKSGLLLKGPAGIGRSRMLDACALESKIAGATVLRFNAQGETGEALSLGQTLAEEVVEALPKIALASARQERVAEILFEGVESSAVAAGRKGHALRLKQLAGRGGDRAAIQSAFTRFLLRVAKSHPLAILIDDVQRVDEASLALLAALVLGDKDRRLLLLASTETGVEPRSSEAFKLLDRGCEALELSALSREQTEALLNSVFGDVPNLALASERLYAAAGGNPRETMELVQQLIASGAARYAGGRWQLPARLDPTALPSSAAESCRKRVSQLSPLARTLAEAHALALHKQLGREDYARAASDAGSAELDAVISELLAQRVLASDGRAFVLSRREWPEALLDGLDASAIEARHRMLAQVYANRDGHRVEHIHHLQSGGLVSEGVDQLLQLLKTVRADSSGLMSLTTLASQHVAHVLDRGLAAAEQLKCKPSETNEILRGLFAVSIVSDEVYYACTAPVLLAQLKHASGLDFYAADTTASNPGERLTRALTRANEQYLAAPEAERVYSVEDAIKGLVYYVAISIAIGSRMQDAALLASLPPLLEPLAPLSPLVHAMWQNSISTYETACGNRPEAAFKRWREVDATLAKISSSELSYVNALRGAIAYGMVMIEARLGFKSAEQSARVLEDDPYQRVSSASLRRIARLHQGDFEGAERFRRRAELLALQSNQRTMFQSTLTAELIAYGLASDLTGIRQLADAIEPLAARFPGWVGYKHLAQAYFEQARGQFETAREACERGLAVAEPDRSDPNRCFGSWPRLEGVYIEVLVSLDRAAEAKARGERALRIVEEYAVDPAAAFIIRRTLALAEAKLGDYVGACLRLEEVIHDLQKLGITGLELGATCEARARIAIWANDKPAIERYGRMTAKEYRHGQRSPLGARYERLMDEARSSGVFVLPELTDFQTKLTTMSWRGSGTLETVVRRPPRASGETAKDRAERLLDALCEARGAGLGHLYLYRSGALELAASRSEEAPGSDLIGLVERFVAQQLRTDEYATVIEAARPQLASTSSFHDSRGIAYQFLLLFGKRGRDRLCAGVAVIEATGDTGSASTVGQLLDDLVDEILTLGDASGITEG